MGGRAVLFANREAVAKRVTEVAIQFKSAPLTLFRETPIEKLRTNRLIIHIQPDEGISRDSARRFPARSCGSARSRWISITSTISGVC